MGVVWAAISVFLALLGGAAAIMTFVPRIVVADSAGPIDSSNQFSMAFSITNNNPYPLKDVSVSLALCDIVTEPLPFTPKPSCDVYNTSTLTRPDWQHHRLLPDEPWTILVGDMFTIEHLSGADIGIFVSYQPWFLPWHWDKAFRFITSRQPNGYLYWRHAPSG
jgi:hypothetical protein